MKKIISTVAALGLVVGVAGTASALDFSISGKYVVEGVMLNNANGQDNTNVYGKAGNIVDDSLAAGDITPAEAAVYHDVLNGLEGMFPRSIGGFDPYNDKAGTDSAWLHTFIINPELKVNDKISMFSELRFARYNVWGTDNNYWNTGKTSGDINNNSWDNANTIDVYTFYMDYLSPVGKVRLGRTPFSWGGDFLDSSTSSHADRLMWWPSFMPEPFSLLLFTEKNQENDWYTGKDNTDNDVYEIDLTYKTDKLLLTGGYAYTNDKSHSDQTHAVDSYDIQSHLLRAYGMAKIGMVNLEGEWGWKFGDAADYDTKILGVQEDREVDAMALMLDASAKMDKLDVGLMYFWAEGQDKDILTKANADVTAAMATLEDGLGDDFNPYYILTGDLTGMLNSDVFNADPLMVMSGVQCIGLHSDFQVSDQLTLHGAIGYAWADDTGVVEAIVPKVSDEYGWEVDLGAKYKLLDNLTYEVRAGYLKTGDFFDDIAKAIGQESADVYLLSHHLTMTF